MPEKATGKYPIAGLLVVSIIGVILGDWFPASLRIGTILFFAALLIWGLFRKTVALWLFAGTAFYLFQSLQYNDNPGRDLAKHLQENVITVQGTAVVDSNPQILVSPNGKITSSFRACEANLDLDGGNKSGLLHLLVVWPDASLQIGDRIGFEGNLFKLEPPRNPGEFDYSSWLARRQVFLCVKVKTLAKARRLQVGSAWDLRRWGNHTRNKIIEILHEDIQDSAIDAGVISAMIVGMQDETDDGIKDLFQKTGVSHLFSVSGLHVSMLAVIVLFTLTTLNLPRKFCLLCIIPVVFGYALITGWSPSSVRAAIMTSVFVLSALLERPLLSINTLADAGIILLFLDPNVVFSTGFQFSFIVVLGIILLSEPLGNVFKRWMRPDEFIPRKVYSPAQRMRWNVAGKVGNAFGLTISAWIGSIPLTVCYFNILTPIAIFANILIVPMAFVVLSLGVLSIIGSAFTSWLVIAFNNVNWLWTKGLLIVILGFSSVPLGSAFIGSGWWQLPSEKKITVFDLGSGGAAVIETWNKCWLIDCGSEVDYRKTVRSYLRSRGINHLNGVILTHGDSAHVGGIVSLLEDYPKTKMYFPEAGRKSIVFRRLINQKESNSLREGDRIEMASDIKMNVIWPPANVDSGKADDHCLVIKVTIDGQKILFTSDSGFLTEANLLDKVPLPDLSADWIISGKNRADPGGSESFLRTTGAKTMLITGARFPTVEKVSNALVQTCQKLQIHLIRFDKSGGVEMTFKKGKVEVEEFFSSRLAKSRQ